MTASTTVSGKTVLVQTAHTTRARVWAIRIVTAVPVLFLLFDTAIKLAGHPAVSLSMERLGYGADSGTLIGLIELCCLALYLAPRSRLIGAVLTTGYLGGAVASHVRIGDPVFSHTLFPIYVAALLWAGLYLGDARVRAWRG